LVLIKNNFILLTILSTIMINKLTIRIALYKNVLENYAILFITYVPIRFDIVFII